MFMTLCRTTSTTMSSVASTLSMGTRPTTNKAFQNPRGDGDDVSLASMTSDFSEISGPSSHPDTHDNASSTKKAYSRYEPEDCDKFVHLAALGDMASIESMEAMLKKRIVHPDSTHSNGNGWQGDMNCLMVAALRDNVAVVEFLLSLSHPPINVNLTATDELSGSALIIAAHRGNHKICELLYDYPGIDEQIESKHRKLTALDWAYKMNHPLCIDILDGSKRKRGEKERQRIEAVRLAEEAEIARIAAVEARRIADERAVIIAANKDVIDKLNRFLNAACGIPQEFCDGYVEKIYFDLKLPTVSRMVKRNKDKLLFQLLVSIKMDELHIEAVLTRLNLDF